MTKDTDRRTARQDRLGDQETPHPGIPPERGLDDQGRDRAVASAPAPPSSVIDHAALKFNQTGIVVTVLVALAGSVLWRWFLVLIPALAVVLLLGTFVPRLAVFKQFYFVVLKPTGLVRPRPVEDRPEPHNFAQGLGALFLVVASLLLPVSPSLGLAVALLVALLAFVNLAFGHCVGCQIYYVLGRRGLVGAR